MHTMDRRGVLAQALMRRKGTKKTGKTLAFQCPRHSDGTASAWLGDHQWGCSACGFTEHFDTLGEALGVSLPEVTARGLTLAEYAERKGLSRATLQAAGVEERADDLPVRGIPADQDDLRYRTFWHVADPVE